MDILGCLCVYNRYSFYVIKHVHAVNFREICHTLKIHGWSWPKSNMLCLYMCTCKYLTLKKRKQNMNSSYPLKSNVGPENGVYWGPKTTQSWLQCIRLRIFWCPTRSAKSPKNALVWLLPFENWSQFGGKVYLVVLIGSYANSDWFTMNH